MTTSLDDSPPAEVLPAPTVAPRSADASRAPTTALEVLAAAGVLAVLLVVFLWTPLSTGGAYSTADLLQGSPLVGTVPPDYEFGNTLLTDPVIQMQPWLDWNRDQLGSGDLPVWNPYNGAGAPHLANFVSAVLSPFSLPRYLLPVVPALLVAAGLKLFVLGIFTYLFLRRVSASHLAALVGASAFMFAAYNVLWLSWPHPGSAVCLPAGLYFAEAALHARTRLRSRLAWAGYVTAVVVSFLAGHPETLFFCWAVVLVYVPLRLVFSPALRGEGLRMRKAGAFVVAGALAVGLSAVQLVPFLEYLTHSTSYEEGSERAQAHFDVGYTALHAFPELFGSPHTDFHEPLRLVGALKLPDGTPVQSNFNESTGFYVSLLAVLLAGVGAVSAVRRRSFVGIFLAVVAVGWFVYVHDLGGIGHTVGTLPIVELSAVNRSHPVWAFAVCALAALGFDAVAGLRRGRGNRLVGAAAVAAGGTFLLALAVVGARVTLERTDGRDGVVTTALGQAVIDDHMRYIAVTFLVGVGVLAVLAALGHHRLVRIGAAGAVIALVFAQSGWLLRDYNSTIDERYFYATSPGLEALSAAAGPGEDTVWVGALLSADANLWYRLRSPDSYDGMGVYRYELLQRRLKALPEPALSRQMFDVLGIRYVASDQGLWPGAAVAGPQLSVGSAPGAQATFTATLPGLNGIAAFTEATPSAGPTTGECQVTLELVDTASSQVVGRSAAACKLPYTALTFPTQADSAGRTYVARFGGNGATVSMVPWAAAVPDLEQVAVNDSIAVFRAPATPGRYVSPPAAVSVANNEDALALLTTPGFSVADVALIHGEVDPAHATGSAGTVEVLSQRATEVRLKVDRDTPGWLVARQTWFPGWTATVNGDGARVVRADVAFTAVAVPAGTSEVVLRYRPASVRYGLLISVVSLVALVVWVAAAAAGRVNDSARRRARPERRARRRPEPAPRS